MATLSDLGVTVSRNFSTQSSSMTVDGAEVASSSKEITELEITLPKDAPIQAEFCAEGFMQKLAKIFKREIKTGDKAFDDAVYISTETTPQTTSFLANPEARRSIAKLIALGPVTIEGRTVSLILEGRREDDDEAVTALLSALLS